jgi:hypothetical protein
MTEKMVNFERGSFTDLDSVVFMDFEEDEPLMGFAGYQGQNLFALGFYRFKCLEKNPDTEALAESIADKKAEEAKKLAEA